MTKKKDDTEKKKTGRKSLYREEYANQALKLSLLGSTDKDMADFFGVSEQTLNSWKKKQPEFLESLKKGKAIADSNVASKLYNRAIGYDFDEKCYEIQKPANKDDASTLVETKRIKKHMPSDTTAAIFWLKNRQPQLWRDRKELDANITLGDELEGLSDDELKAVVRGEKE